MAAGTLPAACDAERTRRQADRRRPGARASSCRRRRRRRSAAGRLVVVGRLLLVVDHQQPFRPRPGELGHPADRAAHVLLGCDRVGPGALGLVGEHPGGAAPRTGLVGRRRRARPAPTRRRQWGQRCGSGGQSSPVPARSAGGNGGSRRPRLSRGRSRRMTSAPPSGWSSKSGHYLFARSATKQTPNSGGASRFALRTGLAPARAPAPAQNRARNRRGPAQRGPSLSRPLSRILS